MKGKKIFALTITCLLLLIKREALVPLSVFLKWKLKKKKQLKKGVVGYIFKVDERNENNYWLIKIYYKSCNILNLFSY